MDREGVVLGLRMLADIIEGNELDVIRADIQVHEPPMDLFVGAAVRSIENSDSVIVTRTYGGVSLITVVKEEAWWLAERLADREQRDHLLDAIDAEGDAA